MPIALRPDYDATQLRRIARASEDADQVRRLLALAAIYDGASRTAAAAIGGVTLQVIRDWVLRFNAEGPARLKSRKAPGQRPKLDPRHRAALAAMVENGPIPAVEALQRFMLANDSVTIATEIPVWLTPAMIAQIEREHGARLLPAEQRGSLTGHIDFLQVRNGAVHILDYKPDARTNRPVAQLTIYALALSKLTGIRLYDIKCAWFNEEEYCEFFPRTLLSRSARQHHHGPSAVAA